MMQELKIVTPIQKAKCSYFTFN